MSHTKQAENLLTGLQESNYSLIAAPLSSESRIKAELNPSGEAFDVLHSLEQKLE